MATRQQVESPKSPRSPKLLDGRQPLSAGLNRAPLPALLLESMGVAVIAVDLEGKITYWSKFAERLYGWAEVEVLGHSIMEIAVPPENESIASEIMELLRSGKSWTGEFKVLRKDGTIFQAMITDSPVLDEHGNMIGIVGVSYDFSEHQQAVAAHIKTREELELRVQARNEELKAANENLRKLSGQLLQMQDEERRRIARELHDSVGQLLAAISMNSAIVEKEAANLSPQGVRALHENSQLINQINREIRTISHLLHPPLLDEAGVGSALRWYVNGFSERSKIDTSLELPEDFARLSSDLEISIFRIVQESLTNIHKHSDSPSADIRIVQQDGTLTLEIKDSGKGIPPEKKSILKSSEGSGVGFRGMRERVRQLGGTLEIQSNENGTVVIATLPYSRLPQ